MRKLRILSTAVLICCLFTACSHNSSLSSVSPTTDSVLTEQNTSQEPASKSSEETSSVPAFLADAADEVILDETKFTVWADYIGGVKLYTNQGFAPCELIVDGEHYRGLYTEDGLVIMENHTAGQDYVFMKNGNSRSMELGGLPLCDKLAFYFYDMDGDGKNELLTEGYTGAGGEPVCHVLRQDTMQEIPLGLDTDENWFSYYIPEIELTEVLKTSEHSVRLAYTLTDRAGSTYHGWRYVNEETPTSLSDNEEYELAEINGMSVRCTIASEADPHPTPNGQIRCLVTAGCRNTKSTGPSTLLTQLWIICQYDAVSDSFLPVSAVLSLGNENQDGEAQWTEIPIQ